MRWESLEKQGCTENRFTFIRRTTKPGEGEHKQIRMTLLLLLMEEILDPSNQNIIPPFKEIDFKHAVPWLLDPA